MLASKEQAMREARGLVKALVSARSWVRKEAAQVQADLEQRGVGKPAFDLMDDADEIWSEEIRLDSLIEQAKARVERRKQLPDYKQLKFNMRVGGKIT